MADVNGMFMREYAFTLTKLGTAKEEMDKLDDAMLYNGNADNQRTSRSFAR